MAAEAVLKIAEHSQQIFFPGDDGPARMPRIEPRLNALLSLLRRRLPPRNLPRPPRLPPPRAVRKAASANAERRSAVPDRKLDINPGPRRR